MANTASISFNSTSESHSDSDLGAGLDPSFHLNEGVGVWRASWAIGLGAISIVIGFITLQMLLCRPWRPTLMFIIVLVLSDWFKAVWQLAFSSYWLVDRPTGLLTNNAWCQVQGFFYAWAIEMSDFTLFAMLSYVVLGVASRNTNSSTVSRTFADLGYSFWIAIPPLLAALGFIRGTRYTNQGTTCYLPVRPFWYRLGLSWVPRYVMLTIASIAVAWLFLYIKAKNQSLMILLKRPESSTMTKQAGEGVTRTDTQLTLPRREDVIPGVDFDQTPISSDNQLSPPTPELNTNNLLSPPDANGESAPHTVDSFAEETLISSSEEMMRRLRRLWVYPLVYFLYWIFPFIYHATSYRVYYVYHPVTWLAGLSSSFIALHCTFMSAAVWVFERPEANSATEAPNGTVWRHLVGSAKLIATGDCFSGGDINSDQRRSNTFAQRRLAAEAQDRREKARWSALSLNSPASPGRSRIDSLG